jgi:hypothetical protein
MSTSIVLDQVLGIIFAVSGLSIILNKKGVVTFIEDATRNRGIMWMYGFFALFIGATMVTLNGSSTSGLQYWITIIGWLALLKGVVILLFPRFTVSLYKKWSGSGVVTIGGFIIFILGLVLLFHTGFI